MKAERKNKQIEVFFVDIGRVLIDFLNPKFYEKVAFLAKLSASAIESVDRGISQRLWPDLETGKLSFYDFFIKFRHELLCVLPQDKKTGFSKEFTFTFFRDANKELLKLKREVFEFVKFLKLQGYKIIFVSNNNSVHLYHQTILYPEVFSLADGCILSHEVGYRKPDRNFWLVALDSVGVLPGRIFVIDDLQRNVDSAKTLGMQGAVFTSVRKLKKELEKFGFDFEK